MDFTHIHTHLQSSLLDGAIQSSHLVKHLQNLGMHACACTDHGWGAGLITFYKDCKANNIKPLLGIEAYMTDNPDNIPNEKKQRDNAHCVIIAKDNIGYIRLLELMSNAALNNFYYKPRIYKEHLRALSGHVVVTTACIGGIFGQRLDFQLDSYNRAIHAIDSNNVLDREVKYYLDLFGDDFYLEIQGWNNDDNYQQVYNDFLLDFGKKRNIPFVITADAHYLTKEDHKLHEFLMAMQMKKTIAEYKEDSEMLYGPYFYIASPEEMLERAKILNCEEAFYNTLEITKKCNVEINLNTYHEPIFKIEEAEDYQDFLKWKSFNSLSDCIHPHK